MMNKIVQGLLNKVTRPTREDGNDRETHEYPNTLTQPQAARCGVKVHRRPEFTVVTAREVRNNCGQAVQDFSAHLASRICEREFINPMKLVWVEERLPQRTTPRSSDGYVRYLVHFRFSLSAGHFLDPVGTVVLHTADYRALKRGRAPAALGGVSPLAVQGVEGSPPDWVAQPELPGCPVCGAGGLLVPGFDLPERYGHQALPEDEVPWGVVDGPEVLEAWAN